VSGVTAWLVSEMRSRPGSSLDRKQAETYLALGRHQERAGKAGEIWELDEVTPTQASFRLRAAASKADLHTKLLPFLQKGLEIIRKDALGVDRKLLDRAAEKWIDDVRTLVESDHPDLALHFTIPIQPMQPRSEGQSRRVRELVQRLSWFLGGLKTREPQGDEPSPHVQAEELLAACKRLISEAWEGQAELSKHSGTGDVESANAFFRKARPILARHYPDEMHRLDYDVPGGASADQVGKALSNALPAFHNFLKKYPA
jgi:hypothetical protein